MLSEARIALTPLQYRLKRHLLELIMESLRLSLPLESLTSDVIVERGALGNTAGTLSRYERARLLVVTDENVAGLYAEPLRAQLDSQGFDTKLATLPPGEDAKTLDALAKLYEACRGFELDRASAVVAVGGGAVGDVAGMLAGTYMRGLDFVQVPTTLVAMISASIGGKVAINFKGDKNLIGMFKHPSLVLADPATLETLPRDEFRSGLGELLTVGALGAPDIFEAFESNPRQPLDPLIARAIKCKISIVEQDPYDLIGIRAKLNLGHTFGHALEKLSNFEIPHGIAVALGLGIATRMAAAMGICSPSLPERVNRVLRSLDLPASVSGFKPGDVMEAMKSDKKRTAGRLRWVLPKEIGDVVLIDSKEVPQKLVEELLTELVLEGRN